MKRNSKMFLFIVMLLLTGSSCFLMTSCQKDYDGQLEIIRNQLKAGENSYTELKEQITSLEERVTTIEKQIEDLQNGNNGGGCDVDCEAQLKELREALETAKAELQNKNNELTLQTTALVKRNQAIQSLLEELEKQKETLGERYPNKLYIRMKTLMEETLNNQADWVLFESYFNSTHQNFMDRLRQRYSDLTTGDLRICCLLRMNLSTKEIASLMNVSVRVIELRRYRLRKRLELEGDTNLVDFLMNF